MRKLIATALLLLFGNVAAADTIAVIGTGDVAHALGVEFAAQGHTIVYGSRKPDRGSVRKLVDATGHGATATTPPEAVIGADIVVLAVPGMLVEEITLSLGDLSDKIIIDPTNPLERSLLTFTHGVETSNAEIIQAAAPDADVVKAFNTLNWKTMMEPDEAGGPVSIPLAGDSGRAKRKVAELVEGMGLDPIDLGGIENAHWIEGMLILWINNRYGTRNSFDFHLRRTP
jgi:predicted dinucleotide-binding enzyme